MISDLVRVAVVEDESLLRDLLVTALGSQPTLEVVGSFADGNVAISTLPSLRPHVVTLDIDLGRGPNGVEVGIALRRALPNLGIVLLSHHGRPEILAGLPDDARGGWSYVLKGSLHDIGTLVRAIESAATGLLTLDPAIVGRPHRTEPDEGRLTRRQLEVLSLVAEGRSNSSIARELLLSEKSVENHLSRIYQQLGIRPSDSDIHARVRASCWFNDRHRSRSQ